MKVCDLFVYPIKGMGGIRVNSSFAQQRGFEMDRRLMLVDDIGKFVSQRTMPELTAFKFDLIKDSIKVIFNKSNHINIKLKDISKKKTKVSVWESSFDTSMMDEKYHSFFSDCLQQNLRLVSMQPDDKRIKKINNGSEIQVSFADGYPYLVLSLKSLEDLNSKLERPVSIDRFRANIILDADHPFEEDAMENFTIDKVEFKMIKQCQRCQVITIDQKSGIINKEPLATLANYRKKNGGVVFGMNAICTKVGKVSVGDSIKVYAE